MCFLVVVVVDAAGQRSVSPNIGKKKEQESLMVINLIEMIGVFNCRVCKMMRRFQSREKCDR